MSSMLGGTTFSRIPFSLCFCLGRTTASFLIFGRQEGTSSPFVAHTCGGLSADSPPWHEATAGPATLQSSS